MSLVEVEMPTTPFEVKSMDITGPYPMTPRGNKYLLTFIDHFTKYVKAYSLKDQTAESCARIYATQIVTRHGSGSKLITDQGRAFVLIFRKLANFRAYAHRALQIIIRKLTVRSKGCMGRFIRAYLIT